MTIVTETTRPVRPDFTKLALTDLWDGLTHWRMWLVLGWMDVRQRYRRSVIGPFWITLTLGVSIAALGVVYSTLFGVNMHDYLPFIATGFIVWNLISAMLNDGCFVFIAADNTIKQLPFPLSNYVYRMLWRNVVVMGHNMIIYLLVIAIFTMNPGWNVLLFFPGLGLLILNGFGFALTLGVLSARFRDIPQLVVNFLQVIFYITPLLWKKETLKNKQWIADYNPFSYLLEIVRGPLLGNAPSLLTWEIALLFTAANFSLAIVFYLRYRWRIPYWL